MTNLSDVCQTNDPNNTLPIEIDSLKFPLNNLMHVMFTGYFNGFGIEVKAVDETSFLYHIGCFGKGSASRSKPIKQNDDSPPIMRKRQFFKRNYWYKKFENLEDNRDSDIFFNGVDELMSKLVGESRKESTKDIIDLVSTDENEDDDNIDISLSGLINYDIVNKQNIAIIVPNSDSEGDNYFSTMKPKSCLNKVKLPEKLMLTLQEAFFLQYALGCLQIISLDNRQLNTQQSWDLFKKTEHCFTEKYVVYHYFRSKGYIIKPGIKFGGDYLLYKEGPGVNHADYIVVIKSEEQNFEWISLLGHVRMANTTVKEVMIVEVIKSSKEVTNLPDELSKYSVCEIILTRNIPATINNDNE